MFIDAMTRLLRFSYHNGGNGHQFHSRQGNVFLSFGGDIFLFHLIVYRFSVSWDAKG